MYMKNRLQQIATGFWTVFEYFKSSVVFSVASTGPANTTKHCPCFVIVPRIGQLKFSDSDPNL
jgi:hypothetical protein